MTEARFFRIHIEEIAYYTKRPKGLFAAVGNLVDQKVMSDAEIEEYWGASVVKCCRVGGNLL